MSHEYQEPTDDEINGAEPEKNIKGSLRTIIDDPESPHSDEAVEEAIQRDLKQMEEATRQLKKDLGLESRSE